MTGGRARIKHTLVAQRATCERVLPLFILFFLAHPIIIVLSFILSIMSVNEFSISCAIDIRQNALNVTNKGTAAEWGITPITLRDRYTDKRQSQDITYQHR